MAKKKKQIAPKISCSECIHEYACSMQCGGRPMAQSNAERCACYENLKSSTAYFIGRMDGKKEKEAEIVHCKECKHWKHIGHLGCNDFVKVCGLANYMIGATGYCLYGERTCE